MSSLPLEPNYRMVQRTILTFKKHMIFFCKEESHIVLKSEPVKGCSGKLGFVSSSFTENTQKGAEIVLPWMLEASISRGTR